MIRYRKTKTGQWVAYGPAAEIHAGQSVQVSKSDGSTETRKVDSVGKQFVVDGTSMVYGYLIPDEARTAAPATSGPRPAARRSRPMCDECGERRAVTTARDLSGLVGDVCGVCKRDEGSLSFA